MQDYNHLEKTKRIISQLDSQKKPARKKVNNTYVLIIFLAVVAAVLLLIIFLPKNAESNEGNNNSDNNVSTTVAPTAVNTTQVVVPTEVPNISGESDALPRFNTVYFATYNGQEVVFISNSFNGFDQEKENNVIGEISYGDYRTEADIDYTNLTNPIRIFEFADEVFLLVDFNINNARSKMYISIVYIEDPDNAAINYNELWEIDLASKNGKVIWDRTLFDDNYPGFAGALSVVSIIDNKYIQGELAECFDCSGEINTATLVTNIETGADKLLGEASNIVFDTKANLITYTLNGKQETTTLP